MSRFDRFINALNDNIVLELAQDSTSNFTVTFFIIQLLMYLCIVEVTISISSSKTPQYASYTDSLYLPKSTLLRSRKHNIMRNM